MIPPLWFRMLLCCKVCGCYWPAASAGEICLRCERWAWVLGVEGSEPEQPEAA